MELKVWVNRQVPLCIFTIPHGLRQPKLRYVCKAMTKNHFRSALGLVPVIYFLTQMVLAPGCANMIPPVGGPKDTLPPVLLKATPQNDIIHFNSKTITLQFDEYIHIEDLQNQLIINPPADRVPDISSKLRTLTIKIKDTLQANTTYSYQFGNSIRDVNENNPLQDFTYTFSTGSYLDSLTLGGKVVNAETGLPDSTLIVLLHVSPDDSAVAKEKPRFVTKVNGKGRFLFTHLPKGGFYLFAMKDEGMKKYTSNKTLFAFHGEPVSSALADTSMELFAFAAEKDTPKAVIKTGQLVPGLRQKVDKALRITASASPASDQDLLSPFTLQFTQPLKLYDSGKLMLTDTNFHPITGYKLHLDTTAKVLAFDYKWKDDEHYCLIVQKGFATDTAGFANARTDTVRFKTKAESEYGSVKISANGLDLKRHPLLQWVENESVVKTTPFAGNKITIPLVKPAMYKLRILYDENQNGIWDTGDYWKKKQPEKVIAIEKAFTIKANWENELEINL